MKNAGFTLVELIIVIVILGILAVTAAPRFINISTDARLAALEGIEAAMKSAVETVYYKAVIAGVETEADTSAVEVFGLNVDMEYGYPEARAEGGQADVIDLLQLSDELQVDDSVNEYVRVGYDTSNNGCYVQYNEPNAPDAPSATEYSIAIVTDGC